MFPALITTSQKLFPATKVITSAADAEMLEVIVIMPAVIKVVSIFI